MHPPVKHCYEFGPFRLDADKRLLYRDGEVVQLTARVFDVLLVFITNSGRTLTKEELMEEVWPENFVEEGNLTRNVSTLRKALGESPDDHHYLVTVPGRGYRFVAEVREAGDLAAGRSWRRTQLLACGAPAGCAECGYQVHRRTATATAPRQREGRSAGDGDNQHPHHPARQSAAVDRPPRKLGRKIRAHRSGPVRRRP